MGLWWVRCGLGEPAIVDSLWRGQDAAEQRTVVLRGERGALAEPFWYCEAVEAKGAPAHINIPREVSRVEGCDCSGGGELHATGCALVRLPEQVWRARIEDAKRRTAAFAMGVAAAWQA